MLFNTLKTQRSKVDELHALVQVNSARAVGTRHALTDRRREIFGKPAVMVAAYAAGFVFAYRRKQPKATVQTVALAVENHGEETTVEAVDVPPVKRSKFPFKISPWRVINTGLAVLAILKRVDYLNQSNMPSVDDQNSQQYLDTDIPEKHPGTDYNEAENLNPPVGPIPPYPPA